jgi:hypothetical protein
LDNARPFLSERTVRPLMFPCHAGLDPKALCVGSGQNAFEVAVVVSVSLGLTENQVVHIFQTFQ